MGLSGFFSDLEDSVKGAVKDMLAIASPAYSAYQQQKAVKKQKEAQDAATAQAAELAAQQERELNRLNRKKPNISAMLNSNMPTSSTMLTGSAGVDPSKLKLSKTSLLGG